MSWAHSGLVTRYSSVRRSRSDFSDMVPNREPYHVMNAVVLIFILALDFLLRVPFQNTDAGGKTLPPAAG